MPRYYPYMMGCKLILAGTGHLCFRHQVLNRITFKKCLVHSGDSGGPLIIADSRGDDLGKGSPSLDLLVGITSYGPNPCGADEFPGVSTNVAYFKEWIDDVMKKV